MLIVCNTVHADNQVLATSSEFKMKFETGGGYLLMESLVCSVRYAPAKWPLIDTKYVVLKFM